MGRILICTVRATVTLSRTATLIHGPCRPVRTLRKSSHERGFVREEHDRNWFPPLTSRGGNKPLKTLAKANDGSWGRVMTSVISQVVRGQRASFKSALALYNPATASKRRAISQMILLRLSPHDTVGHRASQFGDTQPPLP